MIRNSTPPRPAAPPEGWNRARPEVLTPPTTWPAAISLGITFIAWGFVTSPIVLGAGLVLFFVSLAGWVGDIRHERKGH